MLEPDLAQVVDVSVRDEYGDRLPPLRLRAGGETDLLELTRAGAGGNQRVRRTAWRITERGLERQMWPGTDIVDAEAMRVRPFAELVGPEQILGLDSGFFFIVRTEEGLERVESWPPPNASGEGGSLPLAVELVLDLPGIGPVRRLMAVGL